MATAIDLNGLTSSDADLDRAASNSMISGNHSDELASVLPDVRQLAEKLRALVSRPVG